MKIYVKAIITLMLIVTALNVMTEISVFSCSEKGELVSYDSASLQETEYNTKDIAASYLDDEVIVQRAIDDILGQVEPQMSTVEKILAVHDYICLHYEYDYTYNIYDAKNFFLNKTGVCAAYSEAFKQIMNELNINCKIVRSSAMNHDWNLVEIDGKWYHIDLTSDDTADGNYGYTKHMYFLLSDTAIKEMGHHSWNQTFAADSDIYDDFFGEKQICRYSIMMAIGIGTVFPKITEYQKKQFCDTIFRIIQT